MTSGAHTKPFVEVRPHLVSLHARMHIFLTRNVKEDVDVVNGMDAVDESWNAQNCFVTAITLTNRRITVLPITIPTVSRSAYFPFRPGYAPTILRHQGNLINTLIKSILCRLIFALSQSQGAELTHVTVYLEAKGNPSAAHTAASKSATRRRHPLRRRLNTGAFYTCDDVENT